MDAARGRGPSARSGREALRSLGMFVALLAICAAGVLWLLGGSPDAARAGGGAEVARSTSPDGTSRTAGDGQLAQVERAAVRGGSRSGPSVVVTGAGGERLTDLRFYRVDAGAHPRCLPPDAEVPASIARSGAWLLPEPGRYLVLAPGHQPAELDVGVEACSISLEEGRRVVIRVAAADGAPIGGLHFLLSRAGAWDGFARDGAWAAVPRAGHSGASFAVTDRDGIARFEGLPQAVGGERLYVGEPMQGFPVPVGVDEAVQDIRVERIGLASFVAEGLLAARALGGRELFCQPADSGCYDVVHDPLPGRSTVAAVWRGEGTRITARLLVDGCGWCDHDVPLQPAQAWLDAPRLHAVVPAPRPGLWEIELDLPGHDGMPLLAHMTAAADGVPVTCRLVCGMVHRLPAGEYELFDAWGRRPEPSRLRLPEDSGRLQLRLAEELRPCRLELTLADGLRPHAPLLVVAAGTKTTRSAAIEWLPAGEVRVVCDDYGSGSATVTAGEGVLLLVVRIDPQHRWYDDLPLADLLEEVGRSAGVELSAELVDEAELQRIEAGIERLWQARTAASHAAAAVEDALIARAEVRRQHSDEQAFSEDWDAVGAERVADLRSGLLWAARMRQEEDGFHGMIYRLQAIGDPRLAHLAMLLEQEESLAAELSSAKIAARRAIREMLRRSAK